MKRSLTFFVVLLLFSGIITAQTTPPAQFGPTPNERQMKYLQEPLAAFIHYGMNTYTGSDGIEWGDQVKQPASVFNPTKEKVNTDQWVRLFKEAGFSRIILVVKHHDGFCTYPTEYTDYNISKSPYQGGNGDLARELSESCDKYGMDMGIYLSPWDAHEPSYGDATPGDYNVMYDNMLRELLDGRYGRMNTETGKREIIEIWMDGASGGSNPQTYDLNRFNATVRELQPNCLVWMDAKWHFDQNGVRTNFNLDAMWVGNEAGYINDPAWNTIDLTKLNNGQQGRTPGGNIFCVSEADVSIRPGWFYHKSQDGSVKTAKQIFDNLYARSVGMGIPLLLNIPPNRAGEFHENDSAALIDFGKILKNTFETNLITSEMSATASATRGAGFEASNVVNSDYDTYWTMADGQTIGSVTIDLGKDIELDIVKIKEYLPLGQRVSGFKVEVESFGNWIEFGSGETIGYERMVKGELVKARKIRITITSSLAVPLISEVSAFRSDSQITSTGVVPSGIENLNGSNFDTPQPQKISKLKFEIVEIEPGKWPTLAEMRFFTRDEENQLVEIDRTGFTATATSEALKVVNGEPDALASNTIDGDNSTIWQPEWKPKVNMPQSLMYDFGGQIECSEISYLPRATQGDIAKVFNIYTAENASDDYTLSLSRGSFQTNITQAQFTRISGGDWKPLTNYGTYGTALESLTDDSKLTVAKTNGWVRIIGTKSAASGIMEVWVDGEKVETIDLYSQQTLKNQLLFERGNTTEDTQVEIKATGTKNSAATASTIIIESVLTLRPGVDAMFELTKTVDTISESDGSYTFEVKRFGDLSKAVEITAVTAPGTGVHGKTYLDKTQTFQFAAGESVKSGSVEIVDNDFVDGDKDFYIELSQPSENTIVGINGSLQVTVTDNDKFADGNANLEGYCTPGGSQHGDQKTYLESASSTGANKNLNYSASEVPGSVYVRSLDTPIEVERGESFTLNLKAFAAGPESMSVVYQDFRYNKAYLFADWNGDLTFSEDEKIAEVGLNPAEFGANETNNVKANYDYTMDITQEISVPLTAAIQSIPLRVAYHNAWQTYASACSDVTEGMIYDFKMTILPSTTSVVTPKLQSFRISVYENMINCEGDFSAGSRLVLMTVNGSILRSMNVSSERNTVQLPSGNLAKGVYLLSIQNNGNDELYKLVL